MICAFSLFYGCRIIKKKFFFGGMLRTWAFYTDMWGVIFGIKRFFAGLMLAAAEIQIIETWKWWKYFDFEGIFGEKCPSVIFLFSELFIKIIINKCTITIHLLKIEQKISSGGGTENIRISPGKVEPPFKQIHCWRRGQ